MADNKSSMIQRPKPVEEPRLSQEEEWAKLMKEPDPLAETDIYASTSS